MSPAISSLLADLVMVVHLAFVLFVGGGALLVLWRRWVAWFHVPCALYGAAIEFFGWVCPLTPLEQALRRRAGEGYRGGFIEHYVGEVLYPADWSEIHLWLGVGVLVVNGALYAWIFLRDRRSAGERGGAPDVA